MTVEPGTCITCGDVAMALTVVSVEGGDALCRAADGGMETVAVELVAPVEPGDRVLVHARVALEKLPRAHEVRRALLRSGSGELGRRASASRGVT